MRQFTSAFMLLIFCCASALAQSVFTSPLLNSPDNINGTLRKAPDGLVSPIVGDFDNDGNRDFIVVTSTPAGSPVLQTVLVRGDGTIASLAQTPLPISNVFGSNGQTNVLGAAVADFNANTKRDLMLLTNLNGSSDPSHISYLVGNGDGTFSAPVSMDIQGCENPTQIAPADFNRDSRVDLAVLCGDGNFLAFLGRGDGTFLDHVMSSTQDSNQNFSVGDLNRDGFPDLLLWPAQTGVSYTTSTMLGNGDGSFKSPVAFSQLPEPRR